MNWNWRRNLKTKRIPKGMNVYIYINIIIISCLFKILLLHFWSFICFIHYFLRKLISAILNFFFFVFPTFFPWNSKINVWISNINLRISNFILWISNFYIWISDFILWISIFYHSISSFILSISTIFLWIFKITFWSSEKKVGNSKN